MAELRQLTEVDADYPSTGPRRGELRKEIASSADTLFRCLVDGPAWKRWLGIDVEWTSPEPFGIGTTRTVTTRGQTIEEYFVAWEQGRRMAFRFDRSTLPVAAMAEDYRCEPRGDDRCELVWTYAFEWAGPLPRITGPVFAWIFALGGKRGLRKLAKLIEEEGSTWA